MAMNVAKTLGDYNGAQNESNTALNKESSPESSYSKV